MRARGSSRLSGFRTTISSRRATCRVVSSRPTKTVYAYEVFREGQDLDIEKPCCTGRSTHCLVDAETFKPVSLKRAVPELHERYLEVLEPEEGESR